MGKYLEKSRSFREELISFRRHIHQNPELGMETFKTQEFIMKKLDEIGVENKKCAGSGVVALIGKKGGKVILLRGDIDALPMVEENNLEFKSKIEGKAHLCGHDMHGTIIFAVAKILKEFEDDLDGMVKLIFQPGEEIGQGAKAMVEDGVLENPKVDMAMAVHMEPFIESGKIGYFPGFATASMDTYMVEVQGKGGHSSTPHLAVDPLVIVNSIYNQFINLQAKEVSPFESVALVTGKMGGGTAANIIPDTAVIETGVRCFNEEVRQNITKRMEEIIESTVSMLRGTYKMKDIHTPSVYNVPEMCEKVHKYIDDEIGDGSCFKQDKPLSGTEDFSYISEKVPSVYIWAGAKDEERDEVFYVHNPKVIFNEETIFYASAALSACAVNLLKK